MRTSVGGPGGLIRPGDSESGTLVGRDTDLAALRAAMAGHRLVSVTGLAGVGKSRLCRAAMDIGPWQRVVRVRWTGRGPAVPGGLGRRVVEELTGRPAASRTDLFAAVADLPALPTLLVLDDVDPVRLECAGLVQRLLMAQPTLRVLVTCRRSLGVGEERVFRLAPLDCRPPQDAGRPSAAVELFLDRARRAVADFRPTESDLRAIEEVCSVLEGVPLAIELAAQQLGTHAPADLPGLVTHNQCRLSANGRSVPRHRSLREAMAAEYLLCEEDVRAVWRRAGVLQGPFTEETAVFVCAGGGVAAEQVPFCVARLVSSGVLERLDGPGGVSMPRYRMRRAARDFGFEQLTGTKEFRVAAERRMLHCRRTAAVAENLWSTGCQRQAVELVRERHADIQAAISHAVARQEHVEWAVETMVGLWFWWMVYGHVEEGRRVLLGLLSLPAPADSPVRREGRWLAAWMCADRDPRRAGELLARAWRAAVLAGDDATIGRVAYVHGVLACHHHDVHSAAAHFKQAADTIPALAPGGPSPAVSLAALAVAQLRSAPDDARHSARRALTHPSVRTDAWATMLARHAQALLDHHDGRPRRAARRARRALEALDPALPDPRGTAALRQLLSEAGEGAALPRQGSLPSPRGEAFRPR